jgi:hypothetical protein
MSETQQRSNGAGCTIGAAAFGAFLTVVALSGAFAIADTPRPLTEVANAMASTEGLEVMPSSFETVAEERPITPSGDDYMDAALQATYSLIG